MGLLSRMKILNGILKILQKKKNKMGYFHVVISICFPAVRPSFMSANAIKLML